MRSLLVTLAGVLALGASGCGLGLGAGPGEGDVELTVTRDYGRAPVVGPEAMGLRSSDSVMRILERAAEVETSYAGRFVDAIDGIETVSGARSSDWFYFVDGVAAEVGAAEFDLEPGDSIWWDYRDWTAAMDVGAVTGSYPAPLADDAGRPAEIVCDAPEPTCDVTRERLLDDGVETVRTEDSSSGGGVRVEVGAYRDLDGIGLDRDPSTSGVFARFRGLPDGEVTLEALDETGATVERFGPGAGLIAAALDPGGSPVWVVSGTDDAGVEAATAALEPDVLESTYAVLVPPGGGTPIPVPVAGPVEGDGGGRG